MSFHSIALEGIPVSRLQPEPVHARVQLYRKGVTRKSRKVAGDLLRAIQARDQQIGGHQVGIAVQMSGKNIDVGAVTDNASNYSAFAGLRYEETLSSGLGETLRNTIGTQSITVGFDDGACLDRIPEVAVSRAGDTLSSTVAGAMTHSPAGAIIPARES